MLHLRRDILLVFALFWLNSAEASTPCFEDPDLVQMKILPELKTGITKKIALVLNCDNTINTVTTAEIRNNLWEKSYEMTVNQQQKKSFVNTNEFSHALCEIFEVKNPLNCSKDTQKAEIMLILNPNSPGISRLMERWAKKNAGIYRNMGIRLRWESLNQIEKSEKIIFRREIGEIPR